ncbi:DUF2933 domain-containing protein [Pseudomonas sp. NFIX28]|uniref:DUF2933 domain-containing protein n=1 Tax=Pseudomonas sp. NFIX28 TaxID=1566235 RepID=UPI00089AE168|nr:DUF2933 domain-containing protein [Pseudomonas sp. NFIX28]SDY41024.1 Protein of unknown function [Pseudomonas sp. NFIX28]
MNQSDLHRHRTGGAYAYFLGFLAIGGYFLFTEHRAHVVPYLPYLLLLACPLMHFFMHRGHGHARQADEQSAEHDGSGGPLRSDASNGPGTEGLPDNETKYPDRPA